MKLGAEPKKTAILGVLLAIAAIAFYTQVLSGPSEAPGPARNPAPLKLNANPAGAVPAARAGASPARRGRISAGEWTPRVGAADPKDRPDPATIDPQIRFDLLAKLQKVEVESSGRNIFQMGAAPPPPPDPKKPGPPLPKSTQTIAIRDVPKNTPAQSTPAPPKAPPMSFHYYGFKVSMANGRKQAFLLDGEDILIAGENDTFKSGRYKVTHIGVSSITIEDTQFKSSQTLQLEDIKG